MVHLKNKSLNERYQNCTNTQMYNKASNWCILTEACKQLCIDFKMLLKNTFHNFCSACIYNEIAYCFYAKDNFIMHVILQKQAACQ